MSSPNLNNSVIVGCMLTYTSVFLLGLDGGMVDIKRLGNICTSRAWVLSVGFTLAFGAMFSKTWRVHSIFTDIKLNKKVIKDFKLFLLVTILLVIDSVILITWQITDPLRTTTKNLYAKVHTEKDLHVTFVLEYCTSRYMTTWLGLIYAYKGLLLVVGCFLAWETRHVTIPALNDSKYIGMSVYNVVIMCVCGAAVSFVINDQPMPSFVIIGFFIIFCTTITLCLVFVPKVVELKRDPFGEERKSRTKLKKSKKQNSEDLNELLYRRNKELVDENIKYRNIIAEKLRILHNLLEQLGEENISDQLYFVNKSPVHKRMIHLKITDTTASYGSDLDVSDCSDISCGSTSWAIGTSPYQRIQLVSNKSVTSIWTDTSLEETGDDLSGGQVNKKAFNGSPKEQDEEEDEFGGVYLGPPDPPPKKKSEPKLRNGIAKAVIDIHPQQITLPATASDTIKENGVDSTNTIIPLENPSPIDEKPCESNEPSESPTTPPQEEKQQPKAPGLVHNTSQEHFAEYLLETLPKQVTKTEILLKNIVKKEDQKQPPSVACDIIEHI